jgi:hypothetical protein
MRAENFPFSIFNFPLINSRTNFPFDLILDIRKNVLTFVARYILKGISREDSGARDIPLTQRNKWTI